MAGSRHTMLGKDFFPSHLTRAASYRNPSTSTSYYQFKLQNIILNVTALALFMP